MLEKWVGRHGVSIIGMVATAGKGSPLAMEIHGSTAGKTCGILAGMSVQIHTNKEGKATVVQLQGKVDATSAPSVEQALVGVIEQGEKRLVIDCAGLDFIKYGFDEQGVHPIHITFRVVVDNVEMEFEDRGREFNPLEVEDPDLVSAIENRQLGGLGIHLVKKMVDAAEYRRVGDKNILLLRKSKSAPTPTS